MLGHIALHASIHMSIYHNIIKSTVVAICHHKKLWNKYKWRPPSIMTKREGNDNSPIFYYYQNV